LSAASDIRDVGLLSGAILVGGLLAPMVPVLGMPIVGVGLSALFHRGRSATAAFAVGVTVLAGTFLAVADAVFLIPSLVGLLMVVVRMKTCPALSGVLALTLTFGLGAVGSAALHAMLQGTTFLDRTREAAEMAVDTLATVAGGAVADGTLYGVQIDGLADLMFRLWPVDYFVTALMSATLTVAAAGWAATRVGARVRRLPRIDRLDLSPHVLWPFIGAFALMAAGRIAGEAAGPLSTAGLNLLLGVRLLLLAQGLGVVAAFYRRFGLGRLARGTGYVLLVLADSILPLVSMVGLIDFWANFRKLPREDSNRAEEVEHKADGD